MAPFDNQLEQVRAKLMKTERELAHNKSELTSFIVTSLFCRVKMHHQHGKSELSMNG